MSKQDISVTTAIRHLRQAKVEFVPYIYEYEEKGGTRQTAAELNVSEHNVIKTLIFNSYGELIIVLMHGDMEVSTKELARQLNVKKVEPADQKSAMNATGYQFGGTSPFGTEKNLPVYLENTILDLDKIYINGGKRGFILEIATDDLYKLLDFELVRVGI
jgi:Cys-tRNA(Pro) deacylase